MDSVKSLWRVTDRVDNTVWQLGGAADDIVRVAVFERGFLAGALCRNDDPRIDHGRTTKWLLASWDRASLRNYFHDVEQFRIVSCKDEHCVADLVALQIRAFTYLRETWEPHQAHGEWPPAYRERSHLSQDVCRHGMATCLHRGQTQWEPSYPIAAEPSLR